ncbi:glycoside hydrolase family 2 TIM barrel-domain containing protein [Arthrobacter sp. JSM 101049]|uniref:glycoside hydrolase family 2 TIM barrel-domain containing protein n=1 Tax=Arthrobacter sp. JSM 101049 TaxID=929097 RepID=UPI003563938B
MNLPATPALPYHLDRSPGSGALPARAHLDSDRPEASLAGTWGFRYAPSIAAADPDPANPDAYFPDAVSVPGHWVLDEANGPLVIGQVNRFGSPWYTNVDYPFPLDPPYVPDANGTGDHLREFTADELGFTAAVLAGLARVVLRFEGVESVFRLWLNGTELGHAAGSRLTHEFDATDTLLPGSAVNRLVVRVHAFSAASYLEDQDQWWLPGIFRDVTLIGEPADGIHDVRVVADYDGGTGHLTLEADAPESAYPLRLAIPDLGLEREISTSLTELDVGGVEGWTAETPRLYTATLSSASETVSLRLGFRRVDIADGVLRVNGAPIRFRGVNRHEFHPRAGRAVTAGFTRGELETMKRHNINAIRTSHYPPNHHLLDLADELGFWLIDECDLETHGFVADRWRKNPSDDPAWRPAYLDRIERTWRRDANHASVVMFSLGNESGTGANLAAMADWLHRHDPMRPIHYEGDHDGAYTDVYSRMYATPTESASILAGEPTPSASAEGSARIATQPYVLCEYAHAMGNGPGGLGDYEALFDGHPRAAGGFVWEYKDHGILATTPDGRPVYAYGGDFAEPIHTSNFVLDGLVFAHSTPSPGLVEYAKVIEPVRITVGERLRVENRQDFADTGGFTFHWRLDPDGPGDDAVAPLAAGVLSVPATAARSASLVDLPGEVGEHPGAVLTVSVRLAADAWWAEQGHEVAWGQGIAGRPAEAPASGTTQPPVALPARRVEARPISTHSDLHHLARFDEAGLLERLADLQLEGPHLQVYRAPTDNDGGAIEPTRDLRPGGGGAMGPDAQVAPGFDWDTYAGTVPGPVVALADRWHDAGLHRLQRRTLATQDDGDGLRATHRYGAPAASTGFGTELEWSVVDGALRLRARTEALQDPGFPLAQLGFEFTLPAEALADDCAATFTGAGPGESYADSRAAQRFGIHRLTVGGLRTDYPRPQANGRRGHLSRLDLALADGRTLRLRILEGPPDTGFTLGPWSQQELAAAGHPTDLPTPTRWHLGIDAGQHGLGSRSCGVDVAARDALTARAAELVLDFALLDTTAKGTP